MAEREIAIVAWSELKLELRSGRSVYELAAQVLANLLETTDIDKSEIDGLAVSTCFAEASNPFFGPVLSGYLGLELDWCQTTDLAGASPVANIARAAMAIRSGQCRTALVLAADASSAPPANPIGAFRAEFQAPTGLLGPIGQFALISQRYDAQYGLDVDALAKLAVTQRAHAVLNENACEKLRRPITVDDYLASPMLSDPIRLLDCVMVCDGAFAVLLTGTEDARRRGFKTLIHPTGYGERLNHLETDPCPDIVGRSGFEMAGPRAFKAAGLTPSDIDLFYPYDDFLIAVIMQLEHLGFCPAGQGGRFIRERDIAWSGDFPINTGGGQISAGQAGLAGGAHNLVEALRQIAGEAGARQTKRHRNALVPAIGWLPYARNWGTSCALILEAGA